MRGFVICLAVLIGLAPMAWAETAASGVTVGEAGQRLTDAEIETLRMSIRKCYNVGALPETAQSVAVTLRVKLDRAGLPMKEHIKLLRFVGGSKADAEQVFTAARLAVLRCGRAGFGLPLDKYDQWKDLELTFDATGAGQS